jgi:hypothetical protein
MVYFLQRECNSEAAVPSGEAIRFDTPIALSESGSPLAADFEYRSSGEIDIRRAGTYVVFWYVVSGSGKSTVGQSYRLMRLDYSQTPAAREIVAGVANHIKVSQTCGFAIIVVGQEEIDDYGRATVAVVNSADAEVQLTPFTPRAGLLIYGNDFEMLQGRLSAADAQILALSEQIDELDAFVHLSETADIWSDTPELDGLGAAVISSGYIYNFRGIGTLNHQQTLTQGTEYRLIESAQFEPLTRFQGSAAVGTLRIETPSPSRQIHLLPLHFDASGIYFVADSDYQNLPIGTVFSFTQSLILAESSV